MINTGQIRQEVQSIPPRTDNERYLINTINRLLCEIEQLHFDRTPPLRDQFAMAALAVVAKRYEQLDYPEGPTKMAYEIADAMLAARRHI